MSCVGSMLRTSFQYNLYTLKFLSDSCVVLVLLYSDPLSWQLRCTSTPIQRSSTIGASLCMSRATPVDSLPESTLDTRVLCDSIHVLYRF